jgi:16S rRNA (guanine527-N7)-methyltransferase
MANQLISREIIKQGASIYGISLDDTILDKFELYTDILTQWNENMNLVSARDMLRFVDYHILDSLKVASCYDFLKTHTLMDFGSGAGLPGIPLALAFPHIKVTLVESRKRRCLFLEHVIKSLSLTNVTFYHTRIEAIPTTFNETFDVVISRATVFLDEYFRVASRFVSSHGSLIAIKGESIDDEITSLSSIINHERFSVICVNPLPVKNVRQGKTVIITHL